MMRERVLEATSSDGMGTDTLTANAVSWRLPASMGEIVLLLMRYPAGY
jgi:hypothetical protein